MIYCCFYSIRHIPLDSVLKIRTLLYVLCMYRLQCTNTILSATWVFISAIRQRLLYIASLIAASQGHLYDYDTSTDLVNPATYELHMSFTLRCRTIYVHNTTHMVWVTDMYQICKLHYK